MAALDPVSGLMEIANSLPQDEIPFKLRCAICNKLAINAFRLPCCDQAICDNCQVSLPENCPVCAHTPLSADLCKPNKALRTTLKAFLRTEEKKREKGRPLAHPPPAAAPEPNEPADQTSSNSAPATTSSIDHVDDPPETRGLPVAIKDADHPGPYASTIEVTDKVGDSKLQTVAADDATHNDSTNHVNEKHGSSMADADNNAVNENTNMAPLGTSMLAQPNADLNNPPNDFSSAQPHGAPPHSHSSDAYGNGPVYSMNGMSGYAQAGWQGGSNYSQMMQTLPSGVQVNGMVPFQTALGPPGMPGMGMDPMASSQGMFGGYGMNMNGMNNGMNMGMGFNAGQGMYGAWDAQSNMWNGGPDKLNANPFANRMGAEFGPSPGGYRGYNMSQNYANYPHMHQQQQYPSNDFHGQFGTGYGRGRGRGRGFFPSGRGRGGFMSAVHGSYPPSTNQASSFQTHMVSHPQQPTDPVSGDPNGTSMVTFDLDHVKKFNDDLCPGGEEDLKENQPTDEPAAVSPKNAASKELDSPTKKHHDSNASADNGLPVDHATESRPNIQVGAVAQQGYDDNADQGNGQESGVYIKIPEGSRDNDNSGKLSNEVAHSSPTQMSASYSNTTSMESRGMGVLGAPAAPRAMREGLPNINIRNGRGFPLVRAASGPIPKQDKESRSRSPSQSQEQPIFRHRSISKSPSRHPSRHHRRRRHRSHSPSISCSEQGKEENNDQRRKSRRENDDHGSSRRDYKESRSRSTSTKPSKRGEHRSRRDKERKSDHKTSSSHRSRRHRSRSSSPKHRDYEPGASEVNRGDTRVKLSGSDGKRDLAIRNSDYRSTKERASGSTIEDKSSRHRDRDRDRDRNRDRGRDRDKDRARDKDKDREKERAREREPKRERERDRDRDRERDRKRSRRDRSASPENPDHSRRHARRVKRNEAEEQKTVDREKKSTDHRESQVQEKDPHTLEREARNRERLLKEQQRREAMNADRDGRSSRRRESRQEKTLGGRHLSYKYEDEESDQARAAQVELEREAARWA